MNMVDILIDDDIDSELPNTASIEQAVQKACHAAQFNAPMPEVCIRFAANDVVQELNAQWRHKDSVTDVLSFPMQDGPDYDPEEGIGDIILAMPFVCHEATRLDVDFHAHVLHLIIHATLHLLGYDHIDDAEATVMQKLECKVMLELNLHNPYPNENQHHV